MIGFIKNTLRRFRNGEEGSVVVPFALWTPLMVGIALSTIEMGALTIRQTQLERALDQTIREVKLGTGTAYTPEQLKQSICDRANALPDCMNKLQLEMVGLDMRAWVQPPATVDCIDTALEVTPQRTFEAGREHEMMLLRACYKYRPISPTSYLGSTLQTDAQGYTALVSTGTFVHEPQ
ncbi:TadE/TadG family type IV pilus assembly protein [Salipiger abyssi]|uniref:Flp pilus assembly protein TadG n=1 Tax=Salipiger abyssi TaxID=1250539 RepID=A0A1P8UVY4_9RHOB|nr:TadE family protein [Salipiger abyssi]APZ53549.1 Flp pilus assembly protein TadG [Salipiger abyssi]